METPMAKSWTWRLAAANEAVEVPGGVVYDVAFRGRRLLLGWWYKRGGVTCRELGRLFSGREDGPPRDMLAV